ncbi:Thaumatin-like protein 1 [Ancistrocladus abbreviatus]
MAKFGSLFSLIIVLALPLLLLPVAVAVATTFTLLNQCDYTVWPGILSNAGEPELSTTGFVLRKGQSKTITPPASWGGRFWARTFCATDNSTGKFTCRTGDCGSGKVDCSGAGASPPATLAEFKLDGYGGLDFYDVSLVDGYNLPMLVVPEGGSGVNCTSTGCVADLNGSCPSELRVMSEDGSESVACKSACDAFNQPQYCCSGSYSSPATCKPSSYSQVFKKACPRAYSYAYDDKTSTFTCRGTAHYTITFCPSPSTSQKAAEGQTSSSSSAGSPLMNSTMVYEGALDTTGYSDSSSSPSTCTHVLRSQLFAGSIAIVTALWWLLLLC